MDGSREILTYEEVVKLCNGNIRPLKLGGQLASAQGVREFGMKKAITNGVIDIQGKVMQESHCAEEPHVVSIKIKIGVNHNSVIERHCACLGGGAGACKHILALGYSLSL